MKRFLLGTAALLALAAATAPASAADLPRPQPVVKAPVVAPLAAYDWTGFYIGVNGGAACGRGFATCQTQNDWLGTARGRLGYAFDRFLPYVTGGLAAGDIKANV